VGDLGCVEEAAWARERLSKLSGCLRSTVWRLRYPHRKGRCTSAGFSSWCLSTETRCMSAGCVDTPTTPRPRCAVTWEGSTLPPRHWQEDRKSTRLNSSHVSISYAVFCLKK